MISLSMSANAVLTKISIAGHSKLVAQKVATYVEEIMDSRS